VSSAPAIDSSALTVSSFTSSCRERSSHRRQVAGISPNSQHSVQSAANVSIIATATTASASTRTSSPEADRHRQDDERNARSQPA